MSLFESLTDVFPLACKVYGNDIFYVINKEDYPKLIANSYRNIVNPNKPKGFHPRRVLNNLITELGRVIGKRIHISFYDGNLTNFLRSFFLLAKDDVIQIKKAADGSYIVVISVDPGRRGRVIGRDGVRAKVGREFAKIYFNVKNIIIR
jgi:predicted RNA-binding protein YlqC (UPF0109 family)